MRVDVVDFHVVVLVAHIALDVRRVLVACIGDEAIDSRRSSGSGFRQTEREPQDLPGALLPTWLQTRVLPWCRTPRTSV